MRAAPLVAIAGVGFLALAFSKSASARNLIVSPEELQAITLSNGALDLPGIFKINPGDYNLAMNFNEGDFTVDHLQANSFADTNSFFSWGSWSYEPEPFGAQAIDTSIAPIELLNQAEPMNASDLVYEVAEHLKGEEGLRLYVYDDATGKPWSESKRGYPTIGYGHLLKDNESKTWVLPDEAAAYDLLVRDVTKHLAPIIPVVHVPLTMPQWIAITSLAFNAGPYGVAKSQFIKAVNAGDLARAEVEFKDWNKGTVNGTRRIIQGLVNRREREWALFSTPAPVVMIA